MQFGMVGLGRMGSGLARRALRAGHQCVVYGRNPDRVDPLVAVGAEGVASLQDLASRLQRPRFVWLMIPAEVTGEVVTELAGWLEPGDTIIDGGNSHYRNSAERAAKLAQQGIGFVDVGTSGGVFGLERGFCLMIGGDETVVRKLEPLFRSLAPGSEAAPRTAGRAGPFSPAELGYLHCGPAGAGHFVKMVHNAIEYGMMAALAEGMNLLAAAGSDQAARTVGATDGKLLGLPDRYSFDLPEIAELWRRGSVITSWLLDLTAAALEEDAQLNGFVGRVADSGEGRWAVGAALDLGVPAPVLSAALFDRFSSRGGSDFAHRVLSALRKQFGGHREQGALR